MPYKRFLLIALILTMGATLWADTYSLTVGQINIVAAPGRSVAIGDPGLTTATLPTVDAAALAQQLAALGATSDLLHPWLGTHFGSYALNAGQWTIMGSSTPMPAERYAILPHAAFVFSRRASSSAVITFVGNVPLASSVEIPLAGQRWTLLGYPYPRSLTLNSVTWNGFAMGDKARLWNVESQQWREYLRQADEWTGTDVASATINVGDAILYYPAAVAGTTLVFQRPY